MNEHSERHLEEGAIRVRFFWHGDRFAHEILANDAGQWLAVAASVEGTPNEDWPASPPFQSLHIEQRDDGRTLALLVGMAGKSHWSASVEILQGERAVSFDVACRVRGTPAGPLGSTYCLAAVSLDIANRPASIELGGRYGPATIEAEESRLRVSATVPEGYEPRTARWDYRIVVAP